MVIELECRYLFNLRLFILSDKLLKSYVLDEHIGHILRKASQYHTGVFSNIMPSDLTPTRFAAMAKLLERGSLSQNKLGRLTAMDGATIKGVVDRLRQRSLIGSRRDPNDARRQLIELTPKGCETIIAAIPLAKEVTKKTISSISVAEASELVKLLRKIS